MIGNTMVVTDFSLMSDPPFRGTSRRGVAARKAREDETALRLKTPGYCAESCGYCRVLSRYRATQPDRSEFRFDSAEMTRVSGKHRPGRSRMLSPAKRYRGYKSYSYLEAAATTKNSSLSLKLDRVPPYRGLDLSASEEERVTGLLTDSIVISLHEHPSVMPKDVGLMFELERSGRERTGYEGLAGSGMTAFVDNFMDGTGCVTSQAGWKWTDVIADLGQRFCDLAHQDFVVLATKVDDILRAHEMDTWRSGRP